MTIPFRISPRDLQQQLDGLEAIGHKLGAALDKAREDGKTFKVEELERDVAAIRASWATLRSLTRIRHDGHGPTAPMPPPNAPEEIPPSPTSGGGYRDFGSGRSQGRSTRDQGRPDPDATKPLYYPAPDGGPNGKCRKCGGDIWWTKTRNGKNMPIDRDGRSHFQTCPKVE